MKTTNVQQDLGQYSWDLARLAWSLPGLGVHPRGPYRPCQRELGPHKVGSGVGAAGGVLAGAATTAVGQSVAEAVNLTAEDRYWSEYYITCSYVEPNRRYADYRPAYRYGWESRVRLGDRPFHEVESELGRGWDKARGVSKLTWTQAQDAAADAWHRVGRAVLEMAARPKT